MTTSSSKCTPATPASTNCAAGRGSARSTADIVAVVNYARENGYTIHPRGAGTGLAGGCLGEGIVVDLSRFMRRVLDIDGDIVRVQPGVVLSPIERTTAPLPTALRSRSIQR